MAEIIVINRETARKSMSNILKYAAAIAGAGLVLYAGKPVVKNISDYFSRQGAYGNVSSVIEKKDYIRAQQALNSNRQKLRPEQISILESKINNIHPDRLVEQAMKTTDINEKIILIKTAFYEYGEIKPAVPMPELRDSYLEASLLNIKSKMNNKGSIGTKIDELMHDPIAFPNGQYEGKIDKKHVDEMLDVFVTFYLSNTSVIESTTSDITSLITLSGKINPGKFQDYVKTVLEAYAKQAKSQALEQATAGNETKLKALGELKKLENQYKYKITTLDVDQTILTYISK